MVNPLEYKENGMCGIIGYIGSDSACDIVVDGLKKLEYRGYDSAGIALLDHSRVELIKSVGKIEKLEEKLGNQNQRIAIGHTRWATHGIPNELNCHPHQSESQLITLVHNGVIENYFELRNKFLAEYQFYSETDTEVLVNIIEKFVLEGLSMKEALKKFIEVVDGSYAIAVYNKNEEDKIYFAKNKSPFLIGIGDDFNMVGSDAIAMYKKTQEVIELHDKEFGEIRKDGITLYSSEGIEFTRDSYTVNIDEADVDKGIYPHYMLKEINDQPSVIRKIINEYLQGKDVNIDKKILTMIQEARHIKIIAAGTSYYSGLVSQTLLEKWIKKPVTVHIASEFVYDMPFIEDNAVFIFVSQSGETADLRAALVKVKELGYPTITMTNVDKSTLAREADAYLLLHAGREIAVASTKAFIAQLSVFAIVGWAFSDRQFDLYDELSKAAMIIENCIEHHDEVEKIVKEKLLNTEHCFVLGRGIDYKLSLEAALKLKELTYIHAEGLSAGELKHGTIALIEENVPVLFIVTQANTCMQTRSSIQEVEARGGAITIVSMQRYSRDEDDIVFENISDQLAPMVAIIYFQLISYYTALHLGKDIDMPRNLAKSVTVE